MAKMKLSKFICKELLYNHIIGDLDPDRKASVDEFLNSDEEIQRDYRELQGSIRYLENLQKSKLSEPYVEKLIQSLDGPKNNFAAKKWFRAISVFGFIVFIAFILSQAFPEQNFNTLFYKEKENIVVINIPPKNSNPELLAQNSKQNSKPIKEELVEDDENNSPDQQSPKEQIDIPKTKLAANTVKSAQKAEEPKPQKNEEKLSTGLQGFVYRAYMSVENHEQVAEEFTAKIKELGGEKAGTVRLGWVKPNGRRYYHLAMQKTNFDTLTDFFRSYGSLHIVKTPHRRVMPEGSFRLILELEGSDSANSTKEAEKK